VHLSLPLAALALFWGAFLTFTAVWFVSRVLRNKRDEKLILRSLSWPEVRGIVTASKTVRGRIEITYAYGVDGQHFSGTYSINLATTVPGSLAPEAARSLKRGNKSRLAEFPIDQPVIVRYNPSVHAESVLFAKAPK
jgi:hypothetical protein